MGIGGCLDRLSGLRACNYLYLGAIRKYEYKGLGPKKDSVLQGRKYPEHIPIPR
jgi:hypothetical protein